MGNRERLLIQLDKAWRAFQDSYAGLTDAELSRPGVVKTWSVQHLIAHVTSWEEEALKHLPVVLAGRRPPRYSVVYGGIDAFNAQTMQRKGKLTLSEILREQTSVHETLIQLIENTPEHELAGHTRFRRRLRLDPTAIIRSMPMQYASGEPGCPEFFRWKKALRLVVSNSFTIV